MIRDEKPNPQKHRYYRARFVPSPVTSRRFTPVTCSRSGRTIYLGKMDISETLGPCAGSRMAHRARSFRLVFDNLRTLGIFATQRIRAVEGQVTEECGAFQRAFGSRWGEAAGRRPGGRRRWAGPHAGEPFRPTRTPAARATRRTWSSTRHSGTCQRRFGSSSLFFPPVFVSALLSSRGRGGNSSREMPVRQTTGTTKRKERRKERTSNIQRSTFNKSSSDLEPTTCQTEIRT